MLQLSKDLRLQVVCRDRFLCCVTTRIIALLVVVVVDLVDYLDVLIRDASCFRASIIVVQQLTIRVYSSLAVLTNFGLLLRLVGI